MLYKPNPFKHLKELQEKFADIFSNLASVGNVPVFRPLAPEAILEHKYQKTKNNFIVY